MSASGKRRRVLGCAAIVLVGCALSAYRMSELRLGQVAALEDEAGLAFEGIAHEIELELTHEIQSLTRMARRLESSKSGRREAWESDARHQVEDFAHIQAIGWVDADFVVRWIVPLEGNEDAQDLDLSFEARRRTAITTARDERRVVVSEVVNLVQGGRGFLVYAPMFRSGRFDGGVYRVAPLFESILGDKFSCCEISVLAGGGLLYTNAAELRPDPRVRRSGRLEIADLELSLRVVPTAEAEAAALTGFPLRVGLLGSGISLLIALALYFADASRERARLEQAANARLRAEVARRQLAEQSDRESSERLARMMGSISDYLWTARVDREHGMTFEYVSPVVERMTGHPPAFFLEAADNALKITLPEDRESVRETARALRSGRIDEATHEYRIERPDGEIRWLRDRARATQRTADGLRVDGVVTDITEQKRAEDERRLLDQRVQQSHKLESLGLLAGGVAHDFSNLLVGILGNADLALDSRECPPHIRESLQGIESAGRRAAELCRQMLAYAGRSTYAWERIDLRELVEEMETLLQLSIPRGVHLRREFPERLPEIDGDAAQVRQVVMNLITNAADSMGEDGGEIAMRLHTQHCEPGLFESTYLGEPLPEGPYVVLEISDTGCGMDEATLARIFDPFFTTKFAGRGLGLAAALGIVRSHRGAISVESEVGRGTCTRIYLPAADAARLRAEHPAHERAAPWKTHGTALLIDDEPAVRYVAARMLSAAGMKVMSAASGEEGLEILKSARDEIRLVVLDLAMPGLSGLETLRALRAVRPDLRVLITSGCGEVAANEQLAEPYLQKPFTRSDFERALRETLRD
ncbi:MAG: response regulator [Deltaproteobacteria bacterium]|nr:response regulator [Deltaproteobacteria bacterium]